jgi:hypothetical protein
VVQATTLSEPLPVPIPTPEPIPSIRTSARIAWAVVEVPQKPQLLTRIGIARRDLWTVLKRKGHR